MWPERRRCRCCRFHSGCNHCLAPHVRHSVRDRDNRPTHDEHRAVYYNILHDDRRSDHNRAGHDEHGATLIDRNVKHDDNGDTHANIFDADYNDGSPHDHSRSSW